MLAHSFDESGLVEPDSVVTPHCHVHRAIETGRTGHAVPPVPPLVQLLGLGTCTKNTPKAGQVSDLWGAVLLRAFVVPFSPSGRKATAARGGALRVIPDSWQQNPS